MKSQRRKAREDALQVLYQLELNQSLSVELALEYFQKHYSPESDEIAPFTKRLVIGVSENLPEIDKHLKEISSHWKVERMATVDKNILRIGAYEISYCDDIPSAVTVNEMVELAKEFGAENSPSFINGVLDQFKEKHSPQKKAP